MDSATRQRLDDGTACLEAGLFYLSLGWAVLPLCPTDHVGIRNVNRTHAQSCQNPGKVPWLAWKEFQERLPTEREVRAWFAKLPNSNLGMALGPVSMTIRVDVEGLTGERLLEARCGGDLPETLEFRSGRRDGTGRGLLYAIPLGARLRTTIEKAGVKAELRFQAKGAQTVLPPSRHADGGLYVWTPGHAPQERKIALAPAWLVAELAEERASGTNGHAANGNGYRTQEEWSELFAGSPEGARNDSMASIIGKLFLGLRDIDHPGDLQALRFAAEAINERNRPPLAIEEIDTIFKSLLRKEKQRRDQVRTASLERFREDTMNASCPSPPQEAPPVQETSFSPPWHLVIQHGDPDRNLLRSPYWSDAAAVRDKGGYIELTDEEICNWSKIVVAAWAQAKKSIERKHKFWSRDLDRLSQNAVHEELPIESKRRVVVASFLLEHLRRAKEMRLDEDGKPRLGYGQPVLHPDGSRRFQLEWLIQRSSATSEPATREEFLALFKSCDIQSLQMGSKSQRRRWWSAAPPALALLESVLALEDILGEEETSDVKNTGDENGL